MKAPPLGGLTDLVVVRDESAGQWLRFRKPKTVIAAYRRSEVIARLEEVEQRVEREGCWAAGYIAYEAAPAFDSALKVRKQRSSLPLVWFGLFDRPETLSLPDAGMEGVGDAPKWTPSVTPAAYARAIRRIKSFIRRGETYQVNFTFRLRARLSEDPWRFFCQVTDAHRPPFGAFVSAGPWAICSFSPELFFALDGSQAVCRPMKGTAERGLSWEDDQRQTQALHDSPKNRAENIMIVDMVRNDLGRIARTGSVKVSDLFAVERHPTLLQMTSTVRARTGASWTRILKALFPAASITGAPKASTMRIIAGLETTPRQIYTGCIGFLGPGRRAQFNVAIRTVLIDRATGRGEYGVGGGITWDSDTSSELEEAFTKARVLLEPRPRFKLIETLLWTRTGGFQFRELHLERLKRSAEYFSFRFSRAAVVRHLKAAVSGFPFGPRKVRLLLDRDGVVTSASAPFREVEYTRPWRIGLARSPVNSSDVFLYHKTTHRKVYEEALASRPECDDVMLWNEKGELTESCIANLVLEIKGRRYTPPVRCGLLPGTCRAWLLREGLVTERVLTLRDLRKADQVFLANSVRGLHTVLVTH